LEKEIKWISIEEKVNKGEQIADIWHNDSVTHSSICTICDNADRFTESVKSGPKVFVCVTCLPLSYQNEPYQKLWMWVSYNFTSLEINKYIM